MVNLDSLDFLIILLINQRIFQCSKNSMLFMTNFLVFKLAEFREILVDIIIITIIKTNFNKTNLANFVETNFKKINYCIVKTIYFNFERINFRVSNFNSKYLISIKLINIIDS